MKRVRAFNMIELLVVIAILVLLHSMLLPSLSRARELAKRTVCASNLAGIGQAMHIYAKENVEFFPSIRGVPENGFGAMQIFDDRFATPSSTGVPSPTVDMWALLRAKTTRTQQFICPSTSDMPDPATDPTAYYDFLGPQHLSYAYQFQHDPDRQLIGPGSEPEFPVMADGNPYIKGGVPSPVLTDRTSRFRGNSTNHPKREGQNILFVDNHVVFENGPDVGLPGRIDSFLASISRGLDNCYTWNVSNGVVDPGAAQPSASFIDLGSQSDACLVP